MRLHTVPFLMHVSFTRTGSKVFASLDVMLRREQPRFLTLFRRADSRGGGTLSARYGYFALKGSQYSQLARAVSILG